MEYDKDKVDEMALALLFLSSFNEGYGTRAWKSIAWEVTNRLFEKELRRSLGKSKICRSDTGG